MPDAAAALSPSELVLGRYRPVRPLGSGGSGSVWLASDEAAGLDVALKIVPREGKAGSRAEREADAVARLRHERCLRVYALARDADHVYVAYEYVPGRTLRQVLRAGELDDRAAVEAASQILDGLAHAHARGIVHRDVKPSNVLLADGPEVSVRLLDFGLALVSEADTLTATGDVPGTLAYIAPERLRGETAGPAADVWSVGVLLWEALAGRHPFWTASLLGTARRIEGGAPSLAEARPDLPRPLVATVDRALSLDPARRPPARRLAAELRLHGRRRRKRAPAPRASLPPLAARAAPAGLAALVAGWTASALPFYPSGWPLGLAAAAAALTLARERAGLAFALAVPLLPLGNVSLGLALLYAALAVGWLALSWSDARGGLFFALGPLLAPLAALGLLPLAAQGVRGRLRQAAQVCAAVLLAGLVAGIRHAALPFTGAPAPLGLGVAGSDRPAAVALALWQAVAAHPALGVEALALGAAAALLPSARRRGPWGIAALGAGMLAATLLPAPETGALPLVAATWVTCAALALKSLGFLGRRWRGEASARGAQDSTASTDKRRARSHPAVSGVRPPRSPASPGGSGGRPGTRGES